MVSIVSVYKSSAKCFVNGKLSGRLTISRGVSQGSIIYINDLPESLDEGLPRMLVDDTI